MIVLAVWLALAGLGYYYLGPPAVEREAREALQDVLKDAESAKLRNVKREFGGSICGEVNAKNGFGAYGGFKPFYISEGKARVDDDDIFNLAARIC